MPWLAVRRSAPGQLFTRVGTKGEFTLGPMIDRLVARLVKRYATLQGLDPETIAGHSLRAGFLPTRPAPAPRSTKSGFWAGS